MTQYREFDKEAATWDENSFRIHLAADIAETIARQIPLSPAMKAMDFGCGTGLLTLHLRDKVGHITGVDNSSGMLDMLRSKIESQSLAHIDTQLIGLDDPLPEGYDLIASSMTLHHVEEPVALFRRFYRALTPGGFLAIADLDPDEGKFHKDNTGVFHFGFDRAALSQILEKSGFGDISAVTASTPAKPDADGGTRRFSVFLVTARKI